MDKLIRKVILAILVFFLVFSTVSVDVKLTRYKLFAMELSTILLVGAWLMGMAFSREITLRKSPLNLPVLVYAGIVTFFYIISPDKVVAKVEFERMLFATLLFFGTANSIKEEEDLMFVVRVWFFSSVFVGLHALSSYMASYNPANTLTCLFSKGAAALDGLDRIFHLPLRNFFGFAHYDPCSRPFGTFGNPDFFAAYLVIVLPVFVALLFTGTKTAFRVLNAVVVLLLGFNLFTTASRGAWLGFLVSLVIFFVVFGEKWIAVLKGRKRFVLLVLVLISLLLVMNTGWLGYIKGVIRRPTDRLLIWEDTVKMGLKKPFGVGIGAFHIYFPRYASMELLRRLPQDRFIVNYTHNEYLQVLAETGVPGLAVFLWIIFAFLRSGFKQATAFKSSASPEVNYLITGLIGGGCAVLVHNFFCVNMRFIISTLYLFFVMGLVVSREEKSLKIRIEQDSLHFFLKIAVFFVVIPASFFSVKKIVQPFSAHREMVGDAGFFGQKVVDPSSTIKNLEDLLKKKTGDADVYYRLGWIYAKEKNWQKAIENFEAAVKYNPSLEGPYNNLGNIYFLTGNKAKAIENYKKSIELNPSRVDAHFNIGYIYYTQGKLKEASDEFRKVLELDPKNYKATVMLEKMVQ